MSFVDGFYKFNLEINNPESGVYQSVRIRLPKHPKEGLIDLSARVLTYIHCFQPELKLFDGLFEPGQPIINHTDVTGKLHNWIAVGKIQTDILKRIVKQNPQAEIAIYFFNDDQINNFCHHLRGSTNNWVDKVRFYQIDEVLLNNFSALLTSSNKVMATVLDYSMYLSIGNAELVGLITSLNIWEKFQYSIGNLRLA